MKKLHTNESMVLLTHLKNLLEAEGIPCVIRNQFLAGALGEIPATECWPQLWVTNDLDWPRARAIVTAHVGAEAREHSPWVCPACGEQIEGQFGACWQCGHALAEKPA